MYKERKAPVKKEAEGRTKTRRRRREKRENRKKWER